MKLQLLHYTGNFILNYWELRVAETYAKGLRVISQNQLLPPSGTAIDRTRPTLPRLMQVQKVSNAACPLLGTIVPSKLSRNMTKIPIYYNAFACQANSISPFD